MTVYQIYYFGSSYFLGFNLGSAFENRIKRMLVSYAKHNSEFLKDQEREWDTLELYDFEQSRHKLHVTLGHFREKKLSHKDEECLKKSMDKLLTQYQLENMVLTMNELSVMPKGHIVLKFNRHEGLIDLHKQLLKLLHDFKIFPIHDNHVNENFSIHITIGKMLPNAMDSREESGYKPGAFMQIELLKNLMKRVAKKKLQLGKFSFQYTEVTGNRVIQRELLGDGLSQVFLQDDKPFGHRQGLEWEAEYRKNCWSELFDLLVQNQRNIIRRESPWDERKKEDNREEWEVADRQDRLSELFDLLVLNKDIKRHRIKKIDEITEIIPQKEELLERSDQQFSVNPPENEFKQKMPMLYQLNAQLERSEQQRSINPPENEFKQKTTMRYQPAQQEEEVWTTVERKKRRSKRRCLN